MCRSLQDLRQLCDNKSQLPDDFVKTLVTESLGSEIINKVNDLNLVIANHISDKVIDDVIDNLSRTYKGLVGDVGSLKKKRSLTPDVLKVHIINRLGQISPNEGLKADYQLNFYYFHNSWALIALALMGCFKRIFAM